MVRVEDVDLMDPGVQEDWYPAYKTLREQAPVWRSPTGEYVLTRYKELQHVLRHPDLFPNAVPGQNPLMKSPEALADYQRDGWPRRSPLSTNPPEHRSYRSLVDNWFDKAGAARARPMITELANRLIDEWIDEGEVEFVSRFALPLPIMVITSLLGLPLEDIPQLKVWSEAWVMPFARGLTDVQERYVAEQGVQFQRYIHDHAEQKRRHPGDDVLTHLAQARLSAPEGERALTDGEIVNITDHLFIGGNETTTFALASGLWLLLSRPEVHRRLLARPELIPTFVEESLRLESPTQGLWSSLGTSSWPAWRSPLGRCSICVTPRPTGTRPCLPTPSALTSTGPTPRVTWRSRPESTSAREPTSLGSSSTSRSICCCPGSMIFTSRRVPTTSRICRAMCCGR